MHEQGAAALQRAQTAADNEAKLLADAQKLESTLERTRQLRLDVAKLLDAAQAEAQEAAAQQEKARKDAEWLASSADSLFNNDRAKQLSLSDFL